MTLFLWMGQQIMRQPFDPYGSIVHWSSLAQPMWVAMQTLALLLLYRRHRIVGGFRGRNARRVSPPGSGHRNVRCGQAALPQSSHGGLLDSLHTGVPDFGLSCDV